MDRLTIISIQVTPLTALKFAELSKLAGIPAAGRRPIVLGGTGLYLRAALADLSLEKVPPNTDAS